MKRLVIVMDAMLRNPQTYFRGSPDLVFWRIPNDQPAEEQAEGMMIASGSASKPVGSTRKRKSDGIILTASDLAGRSSDQLSCKTETLFAVEVKSKHDKLSIWQEAWVDLLVMAHIPVEILKVQPRPEQRGTGTNGKGKGKGKTTSAPATSGMWKRQKSAASR
jgi:VRR-NUC domain